MIRLPLIFLVFFSLLAVVSAQEKLLVSAPEPGTIRVNDTAIVRISIQDSSGKPRMLNLPKIDGLQLRALPASTSTEMTHDGRRMVTRVRVQFGVELRPQRAGIFTIPSFPIWTGTKEQLTPELRLQVVEDLVSEKLSWIEVEIEPKRVYVHEPVRVKVSFAVQQGVRLAQEYYERRRYSVIAVIAGWLEDFPAGETMEIPKPRGELRAVICNDILTNATFQGKFKRDGELWQRFTFERNFLPSKVGKFVLSAPELRFHAIRYTRRSLRGGQVEKYGIKGSPIEIEVMPIPTKGRPSPFFGAVGRFQVEAALDRDRLRVSESLKLTITVSGQGNFEFLRMPELSELPGFHQLGKAEAQRDKDRVVVTYDLTPLSPDVTEVPSIQWNYFDTTPGVEAFELVATPPLPLVVEGIVDGEAIAPLEKPSVAAVTAGVDDIYDVPDFGGAAITFYDTPAWLRWLAVLLPWAMMWGLWASWQARQRRVADVTGKRVRLAKRQFDAALMRGDDVLDAVAAYLGDRLDVPPAAVISAEVADRLSQSGMSREQASEVAAFIEQASAARYGGGSESDDGAAKDLVERLEVIKFGARSWLPLLLIPFLALASADLGAQEQEALRAYRAGDYEIADKEFAQAYVAEPDRRYLRARGNCLYRMGDLAKSRWAFECARIGLPRDPELLANLRVLRSQLQLPEEGGGFGRELRVQLDHWTMLERSVACFVCMMFAAGFLIFGWRRVPRRWIGVFWLVPGLVLALDVTWLTPQRPAKGVALRELQVTAEPREGMPSVATVRPGAVVDLSGSNAGDYLRIQVSGRSGYVDANDIARVE